MLQSSNGASCYVTQWQSDYRKHSSNEVMNRNERLLLKTNGSEYTAKQKLFVCTKFLWTSQVEQNCKNKYPEKFSLPIKDVINTNRTLRKRLIKSIKCNKISTFQNHEIKCSGKLTFYRSLSFGIMHKCSTAFAKETLDNNQLLNNSTCNKSLTRDLWTMIKIMSPATYIVLITSSEFALAPPCSEMPYNIYLSNCTTNG